jgi:hypothetical protein
MGRNTTEAADIAASRAFAAAEQVAVLLDRYAGDNGTDPAVIEGWTDALRQLATSIYATLGAPALMLPSGGLVPAAHLNIYKGNEP